MSMRTADQGEAAPSTMAADATDAGTRADGGTAESFSVIDRHSVFDGTFQANRDLRIDGEVKARSSARHALRRPRRQRQCQDRGRNVTVAGDLHGEVNCRGRLQIMPSGRLRGKVNTQTLVINEGAYYEGQLDMANPEAKLHRAEIRARSPHAIARSHAVDESAKARLQPRRLRLLRNPRTAAGSKTLIRRFGGQKLHGKATTRKLSI